MNIFLASRCEAKSDCDFARVRDKCCGMNRRLFRPWYQLTLFALAACAHNSKSSSTQFPSAAAVDALAAQSVPVPRKVDPEIIVDRWELKGPFPSQVAHAAHAPQSPWEQMLDRRAQQKQGTLFATEDMACVARELGLFYLAKHGLPDDTLSNFIEGRCGSLVDRLRVQTLSGEVSETNTEEALLKAWQGQVGQILDEALVGGNRLAGLWYGREGKHAVVMLATGTRSAIVNPLAMVPGPDNTVQIDGEMLIPSQGVQADINQGSYGFAECKHKEGVTLPRFSLTCPALTSDQSAWLEVHTFQSGRLLGNLLLRLLVWPSGTPQNTFVRTKAPAAETAAGPREQFQQRINAVRAQAGLRPLELSAAQSDVTQKVAPHYFSAAMHLIDPLIADQVLLGIRAGWSVGKPLREGFFESTWAHTPGDVGAMLATLLEKPNGRRTLLNPEISMLAVGPLFDEQKQVRGALLATYALMDSGQRAQYEQKVLEQLNAARSKKGVGPARVRPTTSNDVAVAALAKGSSADDALQGLLDATVREIKRGVSGFWIETHDLGELNFPEALLTKDELEISLAVGLSQPPNEPWMRYVALFVISTQGTGPMAQR